MHTSMLTRFVTGLCVVAVATARGQQPAPAPAPTVITPAMIALGDSIFHGLVAGGLCFGCHGADAKGVTGVSADLTTGQWMHGDGSYASIIQIVTDGVPKPKIAAGPMPPMGGSKLGEAEIRAVAAYVYSLSHPTPSRRP
jgi:mono/diheme cytochrome c family protein